MGQILQPRKDIYQMVKDVRLRGYAVMKALGGRNQTGQKAVDCKIIITESIHAIIFVLTK